MSYKKIFTTIIIICVGLSSTFAQGEANNWIFGNQIGLDFSSNPPTFNNGIVVGTPDQDDLMENFTSISDAKGNFIFGTSGKNVYNNKKSVIGNITTDHQVAQGTLVVPKPNSPNQYYIVAIPNGLSNCTSNAPNYYTVTVNNNPLASSNITLGTAVPLSTVNVIAAQIAVPKFNAAKQATQDYWLLIHERNSNRFFVYLVSSSGIALNSTQAVGPQMPCSPSNISSSEFQGFFKFNGAYNQFVYSTYSGVYLFDFDNKTGTITYKNSKVITDPYSIEFSQNGKWVYITTGTNSASSNAPNIYKIKVLPGGLGSNLDSVITIGSLVKNNVNRGGQIQLAPDGNMYIANMNSWGTNSDSDYLHAIVNPNSSSASFVLNKIKVTQTSWTSQLGMGLPYFIPSMVERKEIQFGGFNLKSKLFCNLDSNKFEIISSSGIRLDTIPVEWYINNQQYNSTNNTGKLNWKLNKLGKFQIKAKYINNFNYLCEIIDTISVIDNEKADAIQTCNGNEFTLTGTGANSGVYNWYDSNKFNKSLLNYGSTFTSALKFDSIWVEPAANVTKNSVVDNRTFNNPIDTKKTPSLQLQKGIGIIKKFTVQYGSSFSAISGNFTIELRDGNNKLIGTPVSKTVSHPMGGVQNQKITFTPTDWVITSNSIFNVNVVSTPTNAQLSFPSQDTITLDVVKITNSKLAGFEIDLYKEPTTLPCFSGKKIVLSQCILTDIENTNENQISVFPNPANNFVHINNLKTGSKISLIDINGTNIFDKIAINSEESVALNNINAGVYILQISYLDSVNNFKIVVLNK